MFSTEGWNPPLKDPVGEETVQVHRDSDIFSGSQFITKQRRISQSRVIAVEREGEGKIIYIFNYCNNLMYSIQFEVYSRTLNCPFWQQLVTMVTVLHWFVDHGWQCCQ